MNTVYKTALEEIVSGAEFGGTTLAYLVGDW